MIGRRDRSREPVGILTKELDRGRFSLTDRGTDWTRRNSTLAGWAGLSISVMRETWVSTFGTCKCSYNTADASSDAVRNFRGERIIYELAPQEAMAQYSGDDPHQASTVWLDRAFGMGGLNREVILGYDCPADAILLNTTVHETGSTMTRNAICVFEREGPRPLSRHFSFAKNEMGAVKGYELVVRSVSTVGNYDYLVSSPACG